MFHVIVAFVLCLFVHRCHCDATCSTASELFAAVAAGGNIRFVGRDVAINLLKPTTNVSIECVGPGPHWLCNSSNPCMEVDAAVLVEIRGCFISGLGGTGGCLGYTGPDDGRFDVLLAPTNIVGVLTNVTFEDCTTTHPRPNGAAVHASNAMNLTLSGVTVRRGLAAIAGGCLSFTNVANVTVTDTLLEGCTAGIGGCMYCEHATTTCNVLNSTFRRGVARSVGGCLNLNKPVAFISNSLFEDCQSLANSGGGIASQSKALILNKYLKERCYSD